jgi:hypothetical protein
MTWTKEGVGFKRSIGRIYTTIATTKTEDSEDTAANNIAVMYPEIKRLGIKAQFKDIVKGKFWASVANKIDFTRSKISIYVGVLTGTRTIHIPDNTDENDAFIERIFKMYKDMNDDVPPITRQAGQENLNIDDSSITRQAGQENLMKGIENAP